MQLVFVYLPFMNALFGTAPLGAYALLQSPGVVVVVFPIISVEKRLQARRRATSTRER